MKNAILAFAASWLMCLSVQAQVLSTSRPIRLIVPSAPGANLDLSARAIAQPLAKLLEQPVIVENRPGAGTTLGAAYVAKAQPDGYTLLMGSNSALTVAPALYSSLSYDPLQDFAPVSLVSSTPYVLLARSNLPAGSLADLIVAARKAPGKLVVSNAGVGSSPHLVAMLFESRARLAFLHVPYQGGGPAMAALMSTEADLYFNLQAGSIPSIESGRVKALVVTSAERSPLLPDVPTMAESGFSDMNLSGITGVLAPKGTPAEMVSKLNAAIQQVIQQPEVRRQFEMMGSQPLGSSPQAFQDYIRSDLEKWTTVVKERKISIQQ